MDKTSLPQTAFGARHPEEAGYHSAAVPAGEGLVPRSFRRQVWIAQGSHREIERGESNVTIQTLKILADTLGVRIVDLVKGL
jgi:hypothetical protein